MNIAIKLGLAAVLGLVSPGANAQALKPGTVTIERPWVRVTIPGRPAGGYMNLRNAGAAPDRLLSASSPMAVRVELHKVTMKDGIMRMRRAAHIVVPAKGQIELKPGSLHFMIFGLKPALNKGDRLPLRLVFENAGTITVEAQIMGAGGMKMDMKQGAQPGQGAKPQ